jgi:hypothetical protein
MLWTFLVQHPFCQSVSDRLISIQHPSRRWIPDAQAECGCRCSSRVSSADINLGYQAPASSAVVGSRCIAQIYGTTVICRCQTLTSETVTGRRYGTWSSDADAQRGCRMWIGEANAGASESAKRIWQTSMVSEWREPPSAFQVRRLTFPRPSDMSERHTRRGVPGVVATYAAPIGDSKILFRRFAIWIKICASCFGLMDVRGNFPCE